jgi:hypothetical protein
MKFKNLTGRLVSFSVVSGETNRWYTVEQNGIIEVPDSEGWRAKASGLTPTSESIAKIEKKKEENRLEKALEKIKGLGKKARDEICEEYDTPEEVISAIKKGTFRVGGVDKDKKSLLLKNL